MTKSAENFAKWVFDALNQGYTITTDESNIIATHHFYGTLDSQYTLEEIKKLSI